ncbi:hypothetical protein [Paracoccus sp. (in: a-proteobacteria)]|uniref:alpha/beta hydrolase family protein n=1 Tax=Paracoccus sp. TaxID=267 RepID=UPI002AFDEE26|nr:hypothetical protein [Paracoccus sp. (in: a-proteobacteria)]
MLMMHGFTGSKNEFTIAGTETGLYTFIADRLAEAGIASLRIDFTGSGEWQDTTFSGQIADAVDAFDYLQVLPKVDGSRIGILGFSQGAGRRASGRHAARDRCGRPLGTGDQSDGTLFHPHGRRQGRDDHRQSFLGQADHTEGRILSRIAAIRISPRWSIRGRSRRMAPIASTSPTPRWPTCGW